MKEARSRCRSRSVWTGAMGEDDLLNDSDAGDVYVPIKERRKLKLLQQQAMAAPLKRARPTASVEPAIGADSGSQRSSSRRTYPTGRTWANHIRPPSEGVCM
eukprot:6187842-Pleurochrysis_carterae.AAC.2